MAFDTVRRELRRIRHAELGTRFESTHERNRIDNRFVRWFVIGLGIAIVLAGVVTFWLPGPQVVIVLVGLATTASQSRFVARRLDWIEVRIRRWNDETWDPMPRWKQRIVIGIAWLVFVCTIVVLAYVALRNDLLPGWVPFVA